MTSLVSASVQYSLQFFFNLYKSQSSFHIECHWHGPDKLQHAGSAPSCMKVLPGSWRPLLSGRDGRAGECHRVTRWLEIQGRGRGDLTGAAQITVVKLPEQLFVLHRQAFVHFGLLLEGFLQNHLLCGQLSATVNLISHDYCTWWKRRYLSTKLCCNEKTQFLPQKKHRQYQSN